MRLNFTHTDTALRPTDNSSTMDFSNKADICCRFQAICHFIDNNRSRSKNIFFKLLLYNKTLNIDIFALLPIRQIPGNLSSSLPLGEVHYWGGSQGKLFKNYSYLSELHKNKLNGKSINYIKVMIYLPNIYWTNIH